MALEEKQGGVNKADKKKYSQSSTIPVTDGEDLESIKVYRNCYRFSPHRIIIQLYIYINKASDRKLLNYKLLKRDLTNIALMMQLKHFNSWLLVKKYTLLSDLGRYRRCG